MDPPGAPDRLITIRDLEKEDAGIRPRDANDSGTVDGFDLIKDPRWANGINEDQNWISRTGVGLVDDLVGWNFALKNNDPSAVGVMQHGTAVASIIAAEGNNQPNFGTGMVWRGSLIAVRSGVGGGTTPDVNFAQAAMYADSHQAQVVNVSIGYQFARKGYERRCSLDRQTTFDITPDGYTLGLVQAGAQWSALFGTTLFVFAAMNSAHLVDDERIAVMPHEAVWNAIPDRTLIVGSTGNGVSNSSFSNYGPSVELWAPGEGFVLPTYSTGPQEGTSFAAPVVAGAALLLASHNRQFVGNAAALKRALLRTATPTVDVSCGARVVPTQPLLNVERLLQAVP